MEDGAVLAHCCLKKKPTDVQENILVGTEILTVVSPVMQLPFPIRRKERSN